MPAFKKILIYTLTALVVCAVLCCERSGINDQGEISKLFRTQLVEKACLVHVDTSSLNDPEITTDTILSVGTVSNGGDTTVVIRVWIRNKGQQSLFVSCFGVKTISLSGEVLYWNTLGPYLSSVVNREGPLTCASPPTRLYVDARGLTVKPNRTV